MAFLDPPRILVAAAAGSLAEEYCEALREAGAEPLLTNAADDRARTEIDGLLLTGGGDVDPALYGLSSPLAAGIDSAVTRSKAGWLWEARQRALPTLCICRGLQIANVAFGGSLIPDLPATLGPQATVPHELVGPDGRARREPIPGHVVEIEGGSSLARIVRASNVTTGARHHQSVDRCAQELRVVGRTRDGVIEALEATFDSPFWLAVQWHPESTRDTDDGASRRIFDAFVSRRAQSAANVARGLRRAPDDTESGPLFGAEERFERGGRLRSAEPEALTFVAAERADELGLRVGFDPLGDDAQPGTPWRH